MKWYQVKEQAAGIKRLFFLYYVHKAFGRNAVKFLVYFITLFAFFGAKQIRKCSAKYLEIIEIKPSLFNQYRHFLEYSMCLLDKMEIFSGRFDTSRISFADENDRKQLESDYGKGIFFICSHLGNIEVMRALLNENSGRKVNIFLAKDQCKIFNDFIKAISVKQTAETYAVEDIGMDTSISMKDKTANGEIIVIAGDRTSKTSRNFKTKLFGREVEMPLGAFKFAQLMEVPVYFICVIKSPDETYKIHLKKFIPTHNDSTLISAMQKEYVEFLEEKTLSAPFQFFHFYDMFN
ncbi:hypothetical protein IAC76_01490 [Spirochaetes bacterium]|uniref:Lipid A biosynthesis acyltransferase n=1 Tax=Candidatus Scatousia excrementipullorum TaxID=2840936 RepID=A0A9D9DM18_9BACT|nr:hypothetical protein [Candidatus Scatousia excrementipullorum]